MFIAAALLATEIMFTGVVAFVPSARNEHLIRVVAPNGRVPTEEEEIEGIPPHESYLMFDMADRVNEDGNRRPNFTISAGGREFGVIKIESEFLTVSGNFTKTPLQYNRKIFMSELPAKSGDLFSFCNAYDGNPVQLDTRLLRWNPDPKRVGMRVNLEYGIFGPVVESVDELSTKVDVSRLNLNCAPLASLASVKLESGGSKSTLTISSRRYPSGAAGPTLKLSRRSDAGDLAILIGNEPIPGIHASVAFLVPASPVHEPHDEDETPGKHMLLALRLLVPGVQRGLFIPRRIDKERCVDGYVDQNFYNGPAGKDPTCNPIGNGFADPGVAESCTDPTLHDDNE